MGEELKQDKRIASLTTPLGKDKLVLAAFEATEGLSELFEFRIEALSKDDNIDFDQVLGRSCCVRMTLGEGPERYFGGIAVEAQASGMRDDLYLYRLVLRPALWLLTRTSNCRIWPETWPKTKNALDIIKEVLSARNVDFRTATTRNFPILEYCVQYRETDFAFVSRLMEQHGIYYFFEYSAGMHTMVLADSASSHKPVPGHATIRFATKAVGRLHFQDQRLFGWSSARRFRTGKIALLDYNFRKPNANMKAEAKSTEKYAKAQMEFYDYPGKYDSHGDGRDYADVRLGAEQALDHRRFAEGDAVSLFPGGLFTLEEHPVKAESERQYLVVRCSHRYADQRYRSSQSVLPAGDQPYEGHYELLPSDKKFRAPIVTPKPIIYGPHTAKVVARKGKDGEEIDVDDDGHGRIKVRFHWDRDDKRSCWVRVAQPWASGKWGGHFIPRIGMEVVVEFLEGDPDRPLVVGAVYNEDNKYPYSLPDNKTQWGFKSNSSKGGNGYNELMFEDKKGSEDIRMHAQKDYHGTVLNTETVTIGDKFTGGDKYTGQENSRSTRLKQGSDALTIEKGNQIVNIEKGEQRITASKKITLQIAEVGQSPTAWITLERNNITLRVGDGTLINLDDKQITLKAGHIYIN